MFNPISNNTRIIGIFIEELLSKLASQLIQFKFELLNSFIIVSWSCLYSL